MVAGGWHRYRRFPTSRKVLLGSTAPSPLWNVLGSLCLYFPPSPAVPWLWQDPSLTHSALWGLLKWGSAAKQGDGNSTYSTTHGVAFISSSLAQCCFHAMTSISPICQPKLRHFACSYGQQPPWDSQAPVTGWHLNMGTRATERQLVVFPRSFLKSHSILP